MHCRAVFVYVGLWETQAYPAPQPQANKVALLSTDADGVTQPVWSERFLHHVEQTRDFLLNLLRKAVIQV